MKRDFIRYFFYHFMFSVVLLCGILFLSAGCSRFGVSEREVFRMRTANCTALETAEISDGATKSAVPPRLELAEDDTRATIEEKVFHTNLTGLSVYPAFGTVIYPCALEMAELNGGLLFVNGLLADVNSVYSDNGKLYVSLNTVCDILNDDLNYRYDDGTFRATVNGHAIDSDGLLYQRATDTVYILPDVLASALDAAVVYYDGTELLGDSDVVRMVEGVPNIMVSRYPESAVKYTETEAVSRLKRDLIKAYERKFGDFESLYEKPDQYYSDAYNLRYDITNLSISAENDRFYIIPFYGYYYVDKYTDDIYWYYDGMDQSFTLFDWTSDQTFVYAG